MAETTQNELIANPSLPPPPRPSSTSWNRVRESQNDKERERGREKGEIIKMKGNEDDYSSRNKNIASQ